MKTISKVQNMIFQTTGILNEVIIQKNLFESEAKFWGMWCKVAGRLNRLQGVLLNTLTYAKP